MSTDTTQDAFTGRVIAIGTDAILIETAKGLRVEVQTFGGVRHIELGSTVAVTGLPISIDVLLANARIMPTTPADGQLPLLADGAGNE